MIKKILIVGLGSIGKRHLQLAREQFPKAEIKVLRHKTTEEVPDYSNGCLNSIEDAIQFAPQIAVVANPSTLHLPIAQALAEIGTHLLIEKPLSNSTEGVRKLIETCDVGQNTLFVGYNLRYSPSLKFFKEKVIDGIIGNTLSVRSEVGQYLPAWRPGSDYRVGVSASERLGGGVLLELSHELDYLQWVFGEIDWVRASLSRQSTLEIDVEDTAHLILGFTRRSEISQLIGSLNMDFIRHDETRVCTVLGDYGSLRWDGIAGVVSKLDKGESTWKEIFRHTPTRNETYVEEWLDFIDCITTGNRPANSGMSSLRTLEVIESIRISAKTGVEVAIGK